MKIGCVLVLFNPNESLLNKVISSVIAQVNTIYIADNSPNSNFVNSFDDKVVYHLIGANVGIAEAQNCGLKFFLDHQYDAVFFLDQDSIVSQELVSTLVHDYLLIQEAGYKVGAIGPRAVNRQSNQKYVGSIKKGKEVLPNITQVTELISSASLVSIDVIKSVGLMDSKLFIDGVDHEWCWRARMIGNYSFFISEKALLSHQLGEGDRFFIFRNVAIPTPFRTYYQFRNYFWLCRRDYVPLYWKSSNGFKYLIKLFYYPIFIKPRISYFFNIVRGIIDGVFNCK